MSTEPEQGDSDSVASAKHLVEATKIQAEIVNGTDPVDALAFERLERLSLMLGTYAPELLAEIDSLETALEKAEDKYEMANTSWINASTEEKARYTKHVESIRATNRSLTEERNDCLNEIREWKKMYDAQVDAKDMLLAAVEKAYKKLMGKSPSSTQLVQARRVLNDARGVGQE